MTKEKLKMTQWSLSLALCILFFMMVPDMIDQGRFLLGIATFIFSTSYGLLSCYKLEKWC